MMTENGEAKDATGMGCNSETTNYFVPITMNYWKRTKKKNNKPTLIRLHHFVVASKSSEFHRLLDLQAT